MRLSAEASGLPRVRLRGSPACRLGLQPKGSSFLIDEEDLFDAFGVLNGLIKPG